MSLNWACQVSAQKLPKWNTLRFCLCFPHRILQRAFGHAMTANTLEQGRNIAAGIDVTTEQRGSEFVLNHVPGCFERFFAVIRMLACDACPPGGDSVNV